eukprot:410228_1
MTSASLPVLGIELPPIAYPTIILFVANLSFYIIIHYLYYKDLLPYSICFCLWSLSGYISFTPVHEAVHSSIFTKKSGYYYLNDMVGALASIPLGFAYRKFKYIHLLHHKYVNVNQELDPDLFTSTYSIFLPFKLLIHLFY